MRKNRLANGFFSLQGRGIDPRGLLISPNYRVLAIGSEILTMPWRRRSRAWSRVANAAARRRTCCTANTGRRAPIKATLPMAAVTELARDTPVEEILVPSLFIFANSDRR